MLQIFTLKTFNRSAFRLQNENDKLVGKYTIHSQQFQSEFINLPDTVEVFILTMFIAFCTFFFCSGVARVGIKITPRFNN